MTIPSTIDVGGSAYTVTTIGTEGFFNNGLTSVDIPNSVTTFGDRAVSGNANLASAVFNGNAPSSMGTDVFDSAAPAFTVFYYDGTTDFTVVPWSGFTTQVINATASTLVLSPGGSVLADGNSAFTATLTVVGGNQQAIPVVGFPASFAIPSGVTTSATSCITDAAGVCTITFTSTTAGTYAIDTLGNRLTANATFGAVPGLAVTGAETSPVPYVVGVGLLALGLILTVFAIRRRKTVR